MLALRKLRVFIAKRERYALPRSGNKTALRSLVVSIPHAFPFVHPACRAELRYGSTGEASDVRAPVRSEAWRHVVGSAIPPTTAAGCSFPNL